MTKKVETPNILFNGEPIIDVARRCNEVLKDAGAGAFTEKGLNEHGFELVSNFVYALGLNISVDIKDIEKNE